MSVGGDDDDDERRDDETETVAIGSQTSYLFIAWSRMKWPSNAEYNSE